PTIEDMYALLTAAAKYIDPAHLWVNPDCGLKTRQWHEVEPALRHMVVAAEQCRHDLLLCS
ncbi:MAG: hypothetical protein HRU15_17420, partial [Planctomycetes bacterium]|nr:hypothetical protein [Planctomycetota bacterium]